MEVTLALLRIEELRFWMSFFNFATAFLAGMMMAWTRHGQTEDEQVQELFHPGPIKLAMYQSVSMVEDLLTTTEKARIHSIIVKGLPLSSRNAEAAGFTRATWNRARVNLVSMGLAEYKDKGGIVARARLAEYVQPLPQPGDTPKLVQNMAGNTTQTRHTQSLGWGSG
jgi:hypothetical protein